MFFNPFWRDAMSDTTTMDTLIKGATGDGLLIKWDAEVTQHSRLLSELQPLGMEEACPNPRTHNDSLKAAMSDDAKSIKALLPKDNGTKRDVIVQRHKDQSDGFELVQVDRKSDGANGYTSLYSAKVDEDTESITVEVHNHGRWHYDIVDTLRPLYSEYRKQVTGGSIGRALVDIIADLHGTCVRTIGGLYYLPGETSEKFLKVADAFERANDAKTQIDPIQMTLDARAVRMVKRAITKELTDAASAITADVAGNDYGEDALKARKIKATGLMERCREYEQLLDVELGEVAGLIRIAENVASSSIAMAEESTELYGV